MLNLLTRCCDRCENAYSGSSRLVVIASGIRSFKQGISRRPRGRTRMWERVRRLLPALLGQSDGNSGEHPDEDPTEQRDNTARERFWEELCEGQREAETRARR